MIDFLDLNLPEAVRCKFERGRALHGAAWVGEHPAVELWGECLDALAYARVCVESGEVSREEFRAITQHLESAAVLVQAFLVAAPEGGLDIGVGERSHLKLAD